MVERSWRAGRLGAPLASLTDAGGGQMGIMLALNIFPMTAALAVSAKIFNSQ